MSVFSLADTWDNRIAVCVFAFLVSFALYGSSGFLPRRSLRPVLLNMFWFSLAWSVIFNFPDFNAVILRQSAWIMSSACFALGAMARNRIDRRYLWPRRSRLGLPADSIAEHIARGGDITPLIPAGINLMEVEPALLREAEAAE